MLKTGAFLSSFLLSVDDSLRKCKEIGLTGIELADIRGEFEIEKATDSDIAAMRKKVESYGLVISSVCGDLGGNEFEVESELEDRIARTKAIMDKTKALGCKIVQTHIGTVPEDENAAAWKNISKAMNILGEYGDKIDIKLATETGPEDPSIMRKFLDSVKWDSVTVNYDPANLIMGGFDPVKGVKELGKYIVQTHAKDGKKLNGEVALGAGDVDWNAYLAALKSIGYDGFFIIERETGENPANDIAIAHAFLKKF